MYILINIIFIIYFSISYAKHQIHAHVFWSSECFVWLNGTCSNYVFAKMYSNVSILLCTLRNITKTKHKNIHWNIVGLTHQILEKFQSTYHLIPMNFNGLFFDMIDSDGVAGHLSYWYRFLIPVSWFHS